MKYTWLFGEGKLNYVKQTYYNERWNTLDGEGKLNYVKQTWLFGEGKLLLNKHIIMNGEIHLIIWRR